MVKKTIFILIVTLVTIAKPENNFKKTNLEQNNKNKEWKTDSSYAYKLKFFLEQKNRSKEWNTKAATWLSKKINGEERKVVIDSHEVCESFVTETDTFNVKYMESDTFWQNSTAETLLLIKLSRKARESITQPQEKEKIIKYKKPNKFELDETGLTYEQHEKLFSLKTKKVTSQKKKVQVDSFIVSKLDSIYQEIDSESIFIKGKSFYDYSHNPEAEDFMTKYWLPSGKQWKLLCLNTWATFNLEIEDDETLFRVEKTSFLYDIGVKSDSLGGFVLEKPNLKKFPENLIPHLKNLIILSESGDLDMLQTYYSRYLLKYSPLKNKEYYELEILNNEIISVATR